MIKGGSYKTVKATSVYMGENGVVSRIDTCDDDVVKGLQRYIRLFDSTVEENKGIISLAYEVTFPVGRRQSVETYILQMEKAFQAKSNDIANFLRKSKHFASRCDINAFLNRINTSNYTTNRDGSVTMLVFNIPI